MSNQLKASGNACKLGGGKNMSPNQSSGAQVKSKTTGASQLLTPQSNVLTIPTHLSGQLGAGINHCCGYAKILAFTQAS